MRIIKLYCCLFFIMLLSNCRMKNKFWSEVSIDPKISMDSVFKRMNTEKEIFDMLERERSRVKSSDVAYLIGNDNADKFSMLNNCRTYFYKSDTLKINIGIGDGFTANGFIIKYKSKKFFTEPYYSTDVIMEGESKPTYKLIYQKLTLDKSNYKVGDSLYGYIDFISIEEDGLFKKIKHSGKGYFRAKVRSSPLDR